MYIKDFIQQLRDAVDQLDRDKASELCDALIKEIEKPDVTLTNKDVRTILRDLRRKRFFMQMQRVADTYLEKVGDYQANADVRIQLIQALIDRGMLMEAEDELEDAIEFSDINTYAGKEARGLLGRVHKQAYVNARRQGSKAPIRRLRKAIHAYFNVYKESKQHNWWHGINVVACLARLERDHTSKSKLAAAGHDWKKMAEQILQVVKEYDRDSGDYTWANATAVEACIALDKYEEAGQWCERYIKSPYADVFELSSTERQLREVWQLDERDVPGTEVLRIIQGQLGRLGGALEFSEKSLTLTPSSNLKLQAQLGDESAIAVKWMEHLCKRATSVAKITRDIDPTSGGTGFFVKGEDINKAWNEKYVLITNHHVVNQDGFNNALRPAQARIHLTRKPGIQELEIRDVLFSDKDLDTTICSVDLPDVEKLRDFGIPVGRTDDLQQCGKGDKPRLFVIGHPKGEALQISLYDNHLIEYFKEEGRIRYRSPTEEGSSGSPVLSNDLEVLAVHHATREDMVANQGVLLDNIREKVRSEKTA